MLFALAGEVGDKYGTEQVDLKHLIYMPQLCLAELRQLYIKSTNERTQPVDKPHIPTGIWGNFFIKRKILEKQSRNADETGYSTCVLHTF